MSNESLSSVNLESSLVCRVDSPRPNDAVYDQCISVSGLFLRANETPPPDRVRVFIAGECIGETAIFGISREGFSFRLLCRLAQPIADSKEAVLSVTVAASDHEVPREVASIPIRLLPAELSARHYGEVVHPGNDRLLHREHIYGSGPPAEHASPEAIRLVLEHLAEGSSVVDIGCGAGAFAEPVTTAGHRWLGLEVNPACWSMLEKRGLSFRRITDASTPFPAVDGEWDHAICIEVLEHIAKPEEFLREIARVIRKRAVFSVPNIEVLPYFQSWGVVPWHLLEADHKNFFTRASFGSLLRKFFREVEVFSYGEPPLRTRENIPLHLHLFAIAEK